MTKQMDFLLQMIIGLRSNQVLLPVGILLSVPCIYAAADAFFLLMVDYGVTLIETYIEPERHKEMTYVQTYPS